MSYHDTLHEIAADTFHTLLSRNHSAEPAYLADQAYRYANALWEARKRYTEHFSPYESPCSAPHSGSSERETVPPSTANSGGASFPHADTRDAIRYRFLRQSEESMTTEQEEIFAEMWLHIGQKGYVERVMDAAIDHAIATWPSEGASSSADGTIRMSKNALRSLIEHASQAGFDITGEGFNNERGSQHKIKTELNQLGSTLFNLYSAMYEHLKFTGSDK